MIHCWVCLLSLYGFCPALGSVIVEVVADDGTTGVGVSIGGEPACYIVEKHLSRFVEGQDPRYE
jgi:L-rhamnonate dehydratase